MQRRNLRATRPVVPSRPLGKRGTLTTVALQTAQKCIVCGAYLPADTQAQWRTGCVQYACITCDFKRELANIQ